MDAVLTHAYRLVWADLVLIYDACLICYRHDALTPSNVASALQLILQREHDAAHANWYKAQAWAAAASSPGGGGGGGARGAPSSSAAAAKAASAAHISNRDSSAIDDEDGVGGTVHVLGLVWDFVHGVLLSFCVEELSQYPFWCTKVAVLTGDVASVGAARGACVVATMIGGGGGASDVSPSFGSLPLSAIVSRVSASLFGWLRAIELRFDGPARLIRLFYGLGPFLTFRAIQSAEYIEASLRPFLDLVSVNRIARGARISDASRTVSTIDASKIREPKGYARGTRRQQGGSNTRGGASERGQQPPSLIAASTQNPEAPPSSYFANLFGGGVVLRVGAAIAIQPFFVAAVRCVSDTSNNLKRLLGDWLRLWTPGGLRGLFAGVTTSIAMSILPLPGWATCGVADSIVILRANGAGGEGTADLVRRLLEAPSDASVPGALKQATSRLLSHGDGPIANVFQYGIMTIGQIIPGFAAFCAARLTLAMLVGATPQRNKEVAIRQKIIDDWFALRAGSIPVVSGRHGPGFESPAATSTIPPPPLSNSNSNSNHSGPLQHQQAKNGGLVRNRSGGNVPRMYGASL